MFLTLEKSEMWFFPLTGVPIPSFVPSSQSYQEKPICHGPATHWPSSAPHSLHMSA